MKILDNEIADIGVGTLIIFIAMVLVAAVAATVLIYTTGALQQKAMITGKDAPAKVTSNIVVEGIIGDRVNSSVPGLQPGIQGLLIRIKPEVGAESLDLRNIIIMKISTEKNEVLRYSNTSNNPNTFSASLVRDEDMSFRPDTPVLNSGDLVDIEIYTADHTNPILIPKETISISLNQERGASIDLEITAPNSFGINRYIILYP